MAKARKAAVVLEEIKAFLADIREGWESSAGYENELQVLDDLEVLVGELEGHSTAFRVYYGRYDGKGTGKTKFFHAEKSAKEFCKKLADKYGENCHNRAKMFWRMERILETAQGIQNVLQSCKEQTDQYRKNIRNTLNIAHMGFTDRVYED